MAVYKMTFKTMKVSFIGTTQYLPITKANLKVRFEKRKGVNERKLAMYDMYGWEDIEFEILSNNDDDKDDIINSGEHNIWLNHRPAPSAYRAVNCIDRHTGNTLRTYRSIASAAKQLGINNEAICHCLAGRQKTSGGYKWTYAE